MTPDENLQLLETMDAHRRFILAACMDNPTLLAQADERIRWLLDPDLPIRLFGDTQITNQRPQL